MKSFLFSLFVAFSLTACNQAKSVAENKDSSLLRNDSMLIALTFDDGPNTNTTRQVLEKLEKHNILASFFVIGDSISDASAEYMKKASQKGCDIENHTRTHRPMPSLSPEEQKAEVEWTTKRINEFVKNEVKFFRPPYIAMNDSVYDNVPYTFICGVDCEDWLPEVSAQERAQREIDAAKHGGIILMHDFGGNDNTVEALDILIPALKEKGFEFVTISQLFARCGVTPQHGKIYSNVFE